MFRIKYHLCEEALSAEDIASAFSNPMESEENKVKPVETPPVPDPPTPPADAFVPRKEWDILKSSDDSFKLPENLSKDNEEQLLVDSIKSKFGIKEPELHPLAKQVQELAIKNPDITINDLVQDVQSQFIDVSKMSADERIATHLKMSYGVYDENENPDGLTEDDIKEHISKMTKVEKQELSKQIEKHVEAYNKEILDSYELKKKEEFESNYNLYVENANKLVTDVANQTSKLESIFGIPVSQEEHKAFLEEFKAFITPDKETRLRGIDTMLSDDVALYKLFVLSTKFGEEKVIQAITKGKETAKGDLFKKLGLTPNFSGSREQSGRIDNPETIVAAFSHAGSV